MQIPKIPTDNLYKFKALSGIILIIASLFVFIYLEKDKYESLIEIAKYSELSSIDSTQINDSIIYYEKLLDIKETAFKQKYKFHHDSLYIENPVLNSSMIKDIENIWNIKLKIQNLRSKSEFRNTELRIQNKIENIKEIFYKFSYVVLIILGGFGILLSIFGFRQWYVRTQKYFDKKLIKDALIESKYIEKSEALRTIHCIYYDMMPEKKHEDEDWDDVLSNISSKFSNIQTKLENFRNSYSYILTENSNKLLNESIQICSESIPDDEKKLHEKANSLYKNIISLMDNIEKLLKDETN